MKLVNLFVMVSRWYGGILLHQDRFKRINDSAKNLLNSYLDSFEIPLPAVYAYVQFLSSLNSNKSRPA